MRYLPHALGILVMGSTTVGVMVRISKGYRRSSKQMLEKEASILIFFMAVAVAVRHGACSMISSPYPGTAYLGSNTSEYGRNRCHSLGKTWHLHGMESFFRDQMGKIVSV